MRQFINLITEAAYDTLVAAIMREHPDKSSDIRSVVTWAKQSLKRADRITWYLRIYRASLAGDNLSPYLGTYRFSGISQLGDDILHFYGYNDHAIESYLFNKQTVSDVIVQLTKLEKDAKLKQEKDKPVNVLPGDKEIMKFPDGTSWWFVDRAYCADEGRSGGHCGNVVGKRNTDERILSFRKNGKVLLTFILHKNGFMGEMKGHSNMKPDSKYHTHIMDLLLKYDPIVGIVSGGYAPERNFSVFDLNDVQLRKVANVKPNLISSELARNPGALLSAPLWVRASTELSGEARSNLQGILGDDGSISTRVDAWESAIETNPDLIVYVPASVQHKIPEWTKQAIETIHIDIGLYNSAPVDVKNNEYIISGVINRGSPEIIGLVNGSAPNYDHLAMLAVKQNGSSLIDIPSNKWTNELVGTAIADAPELLTDKRVASLPNLLNIISTQTNELRKNDFRRARWFADNVLLSELDKSNLPLDFVATMCAADPSKIPLFDFWPRAQYIALVAQAAKLSGDDPDPVLRYADIKSFSDDEVYTVMDMAPITALYFSARGKVSIEKLKPLVKTVPDLIDRIPEHDPDYVKLAKQAIQTDIRALRHLRPSSDHYEELVRYAMGIDQRAIHSVDSGWARTHPDEMKSMINKTGDSSTRAPREYSMEQRTTDKSSITESLNTLRRLGGIK